MKATTNKLLRPGLWAPAVLIGLSLFLAVAPPAQAQAGGPTLLSGVAQVDFPLKLTFGVSARSDVPISDIRLRYRVEQEAFADVTSEEQLAFTPGTSVEASVSLDLLRIGGLPPGVVFDYWWRITDSGGAITETSPTSVTFSDNRYTWSRLDGDNLSIFWYQGGDAFARELMQSATEGLAQLSADTGAILDRPVDIYIYASTADLQGAMVYPSEWTGGATYPRFSTIVIGVSPVQLDWGKGAVIHELTHMVNHQMTRNPYAGVPVWLDEGLATYAQGLPSPAFTTALYQAVRNGTLISVRSLSSPFSALSDQANLSYAESYSIVSFLLERYGPAKMLELLGTFRQGNTYDGALEQVFGFDTEGLDSLWRSYVRDQYVPSSSSSPTSATGGKGRPAPVAALLILSLSLPGGLGIMFVKRRRAVRL